MTVSKKEKADKGTVQYWQDKLFLFWPISLLLMAFTFLSNIENVENFSKYLSQFLEEWRAFLHGAIEFPINIILKVLRYEAVNIPSPWPELFVLTSLFLFTYFRARNLVEIRWIQNLLIKQIELGDVLTRPILERITIKNVLVYVFGLFLGLFLWLWALFIIIFVMMANLSSLESAISFGALILAAPIWISYSLPKRSDRFDGAIWIQGYIVAPAVIILSVGIVLLAASLEIIVLNAISFIERAN